MEFEPKDLLHMARWTWGGGERRKQRQQDRAALYVTRIANSFMGGQDDTTQTLEPRRNLSTSCNIFDHPDIAKQVRENVVRHDRETERFKDERSFEVGFRVDSGLHEICGGILECDQKISFD